MRSCAVCHSQVRKGKGVYYAGRLVHRKCLGKAKLLRMRFLPKK